MRNYKNGKIYKIISKLTDKIYIGSTTASLEARFKQHKQKYRDYLLNRTKKYISSFEILKCDDAVIILLQNYSCNNKKELFYQKK